MNVTKLHATVFVLLALHDVGSAQDPWYIKSPEACLLSLTAFPFDASSPNLGAEAVALSTDGARVAAAVRSQIRVFDAASGAPQITFTLPLSPPPSWVNTAEAETGVDAPGRCVALQWCNSNACLLAVDEFGAVKLWDVGTGAEVLSGSLAGHHVTRAAVSESANRICFGTMGGGILEFVIFPWAASHVYQASSTSSAPVSFLRYAHTGQYLLSSLATEDSTIPNAQVMRWDMSTGVAAGSYAGSIGARTACDFSGVLVTGRETGTGKIYDLQLGQIGSARVFSQVEPVQAANLSYPYALSTIGSSVSLISLSTMEEILVQEWPVPCVSMHGVRNLSRVVTSHDDGQVRVFEVAYLGLPGPTVVSVSKVVGSALGRSLRIDYEMTGHEFPIHALAASESGEDAVSIDSKGNAVVWTRVASGIQGTPVPFTVATSSGSDYSREDSAEFQGRTLWIRGPNGSWLRSFDAGSQVSGPQLSITSGSGVHNVKGFAVVGGEIICGTPGGGLLRASATTGAVVEQFLSDGASRWRAFTQLFPTPQGVIAVPFIRPIGGVSPAGANDVSLWSVQPGGGYVKTATLTGTGVCFDPAAVMDDSGHLVLSVPNGFWSLDALTLQTHRDVDSFLTATQIASLGSGVYLSTNGLQLALWVDGPSSIDTGTLIFNPTDELGRGHIVGLCGWHDTSGSGVWIACSDGVIMYATLQ